MVYGVVECSFFNVAWIFVVDSLWCSVEHGTLKSTVDLALDGVSSFLVSGFRAFLFVVMM
jgi:hypothetical protein